MPYTSNAFTVAQVLGQPSVLTLTDVSVGADPAVVERRVYLQKADSSYLPPAGGATDYHVWALGSSSVSIDALDRDYALRITVLYVDASGTALYTASDLCLFTLHLEQFYYDLTQTQTGTPNVVNDTPYYQSKIRLRCALDEAENAVVYGDDQYSAQSALDRGQFLVDHQTLYF